MSSLSASNSLQSRASHSIFHSDSLLLERYIPNYIHKYRKTVAHDSSGITWSRAVHWTNAACLLLKFQVISAVGRDRDQDQKMDQTSGDGAQEGSFHLQTSQSRQNGHVFVGPLLDPR
jgi:hypothetical protein